MCQVRLPWNVRGKKNESLARCVEYAAAHSGVDEFAFAKAMSYFLEQIADENTKGRPVMIPGFGIFIPVPDRHNAREGQAPRCRVKFHPSVGYAQQVRHGAPPLSVNSSRSRAYQQNHSGRETAIGNSARVFTAMHRFRRDIASQLANARG